MKFEIIDAAIVILALLMLAAYLTLQNIVFIYVFVLLIAAEVIAQFLGRTKKPHETHAQEPAAQ